MLTYGRQRTCFPLRFPLLKPSYTPLGYCSADISGHVIVVQMASTLPIIRRHMAIAVMSGPQGIYIERAFNSCGLLVSFLLSIRTEVRSIHY